MPEAISFFRPSFSAEASSHNRSRTRTLTATRKSDKSNFLPTQKNASRGLPRRNRVREDVCVVVRSSSRIAADKRRGLAMNLKKTDNFPQSDPARQGSNLNSPNPSSVETPDLLHRASAAASKPGFIAIHSEVSDGVHARTLQL
jgi:hypothetical protein